MTEQIAPPLHILLADDDTDDCLFFKEALKDCSLPTHLKTVENGEQLMQVLTDETSPLPDVLFLDMNMPRKNGLECLTEIKQHEKLEHLPVIIYTTTFHKKAADLLYGKGAHYYISKPSDISSLKKAVNKSIALITQGKVLQPEKEEFVITSDLKNYKSFAWFSTFFTPPPFFLQNTLINGYAN